MDRDIPKKREGVIDRGDGRTLQPERVDVREMGDVLNEVKINSRVANNLLGENGLATKLAAQC